MDTAAFRAARSIQVDIPLGRSDVRIFLGLAEEFVELLLQNLAMHLFGLDGLAEDLIPPARFALQFGDSGGKILNGRWLFGYLVGNHGLRFGIDLKLCLTARTLHLE